VELWRDHPPPPFCFQHQYMLLTMWVSCSAPIDTSLSAVAPPHSVTRMGAWMRCASYTAVFSAKGYLRRERDKERERERERERETETDRARERKRKEEGRRGEERRREKRE